MRIVVAPGGNALLKRGRPTTADRQRTNIRAAARALAPPAHKHERVSRTGTDRGSPVSGRRSGALAGIEAIVESDAGTRVCPDGE